MTERQGKEMPINREMQLLMMTEGREKMMELLKTISTKEVAASAPATLTATVSTVSATTKETETEERKRQVCGLAGDSTVRRALLMLIDVAGNGKGEDDNNPDSINDKMQQ